MRQDSSPSLEEFNPPNCHYHNNPITHFCTQKSCTLPLCKECLPIHKIQHQNNKQTSFEAIIELQTAKENSLMAFQSRKTEIIVVQQQFTNKLMEYKKIIIQVVDHVVNTFLENSLIADGSLQILSQIDMRIKKIRRGSLKQLIRYYEQVYDPERFRKMYTMSGDYLMHLNYQVDQTTLSQIIKKSFNLTLKESNEAFKGETQPQQNITHEVPFDASKQRKFVKEEDNQSQIESYQFFKSKMQQQSDNLNSKINHRINDVLPTHHSHQHNHTSQPQRNKSKKKKGLSLTKSHRQLPTSIIPALKQQSANLLAQQMVSKKINQNKFIKRRQSSPQKLTPQHIQVLNPKQMRELITKRKNIEKGRCMDQLMKISAPANHF